MPLAGRLRPGLTFAFCLVDSCAFRSLFVPPTMLLASSRGATVQPLTKRQREILDYLNDFIQQHGYAPSLEEIGRRFSLSSLATVHKHLTNLQQKGFIKRAWNRSRSVELRADAHSAAAPSSCRCSATSPPARPIEAVVGNETIAVPEDPGRQARHLRAPRQGRLDDRRADSRRRLRHRRGPPHRRQRRDGHRAAERLRRHAQEALSRAGAHPAAAGQPGDAADHRRSPSRCRCRAWSSA